MNAYIYMAIPIYSKLKNQRGIESDALLLLVAILGLLVKYSLHPLGGWLHRVSWLDILTPLALDRWILCSALYGGN